MMTNTKKKTVLLRAPVLTQSGYGVHARQIAAWLLARPDLDVKIQLLPWGNTPWFIGQENLLIEEIMKRSVPFEGKADVSIQLQLPNEWDPTLGTFNVGMTASVETDKCNPAWGGACNKMDQIIVPSRHAEMNIKSHNNVTVPVAIIPEAYTQACEKHPSELPIDELPDFSTPFNFLIFGQITVTGSDPLTDRKNTFNMLKWLFDVFKNNPEVGVVIKTNAGRNSLIDKGRVVGLITQIIRETRIGDFPRVHVLHGDMSEDLVAALYKHPKIKALVAATRGEGYGLPILEAAASGLPIIATNWSGHLDFLRHGKFIKLYYQLGDVHKGRIDNQIFMPGVRWAYPAESDFKEKVLKFKNKPDIPKQWADDLRVEILKRYSLQQISQSYDDLFEAIL